MERGLEMTKSQVLEQAFQLPAKDQLEVAQTLLDHNAGPDDFHLTPELQSLLERRLAEAKAHP